MLLGRTTRDLKADLDRMRNIGIRLGLVTCQLDELSQ